MLLLFCLSFELEDKEENHRNVSLEGQSLDFHSFDMERKDEWVSHRPSEQVIAIENGPFCQYSALIEEETMD